MVDRKKTGEYELRGERVPHGTTRPGTGPQSAVPTHVSEPGTPIQPIVIQMPAQPPPPAAAASHPYPPRKPPMDILGLAAAVVVAVIFSLSGSVYVVSKLLDEHAHRAKRTDEKLDDLTTKVREIDARLTRTEAQVENLNERRSQR